LRDSKLLGSPGEVQRFTDRQKLAQTP